MTTAASQRPVRVLIADDHQLFADLVRMGLARDGRLEVVGVAYDGGRALELAATLEPDVTLMDVFMPVMDGIEATRRLVELRPGARVIVLSGVTSPTIVVRAREAGATRCMTKEAFVQELASTILAVASA